MLGVSIHYTIFDMTDRCLTELNVQGCTDWWVIQFFSFLHKGYVLGSPVFDRDYKVGEEDPPSLHCL